MSHIRIYTVLPYRDGLVMGVLGKEEITYFNYSCNVC